MSIENGEVAENRKIDALEKSSQSDNN